MPKKKRTPAELAKIAEENWKNRHKKKVVKAKPKKKVVVAKPKKKVVVVDAKTLKRRRKARERYALKKQKAKAEKAKADYKAGVERKGGKVVEMILGGKHLPRYKTFDPELIRQGVAGGDSFAGEGWVLGHEPLKTYKLSIHGQTERDVRQDYLHHHGFGSFRKPSAVRREGEKERADVEETYRTRLPEFRNALGRYNRRVEELGGYR